MNASELREFLASQKDFLTENVPSEYNDVISDSGREGRGTVDIQPVETVEDRSTFTKLLPWIVLLISALGLFYFLEKGSNPPPEPMKNDNVDSINNVRRMDSIRNQTVTDSISKINITPDSLE